MQTSTNTVSAAQMAVKTGFQPRQEQPVYRIRATESIEDLCRFDDDGFEAGDWTDALLLD